MKHFLLVYNKKTGDLLRITEFEAETGAAALQERFDLEREYRSKPDVEIVVLNADSREALYGTHARYFPNGLAEKIAELVR